MGVFDHLQKKGSFVIQPKRPQIRKVEAKLPPKPSPKPEPRSTPATSRSKSAGHSHQTSRDSTPSQRSSSTQRLGPPSRSLSRKRRSPVLRLSSSDDDSDTDTSFEVRKRVKLSASVEPDLDRRVRHKKAFIEGVDQSISMVHAAEITSVEKPSKFKAAFEGSNQPAKVKLQYPSASPMERYQLVVPREKDDFRPLDDIVQVMEVVSQNYIPDEYLHLFDDETTGFKRRIRKSLAHGSAKEFCSTLDDYNTTISRLRRDGVISKHLDQAHSLTLSLVERILTQIYSRTVSPRVHSLREYENGTDNVYGELLPRFVSNIFKETKLKSNQIFVDLGSGVGNVVLQAALEVGCESWGCEMMHNACDLAQLQEREFRVRSRLWGLAVGKTHLIRGDFLKEDSVTQILSKADVVLINNQAFTPQLNNELINHFLDMKEGCQIVSLKSFVPAGHKIQARNLNSPINLLTVKQKEYWSDSVSWTDAGGTYFIAKKDSSRLKAFMDEM